MKMLPAWADPEGVIGGPDHEWPYVSLETLAPTPLKKKLDPKGPIASQESFIWPSVKYVDD